MGISCRKVWIEISNYVDQDVAPALRLAMDEHFAECTKCAAVLQGTLNVIRLYRDERMLAVPAEFRNSIMDRLAGRMEGARGTIWPLVMSLAAALLLAVGFAGAGLHDANSILGIPYLSVMSAPASGIPAQVVAISDFGKVFHVRNCPYLHGEEKLIPAEEAVRRGYNPCVRCMAEFVEHAEAGPSEELEQHMVASIIPGN
jgi:hypothetical protein